MSCRRPARFLRLSRASARARERLDGWRWRRERDSNPRYGCPYTRSPGVRLRPLGHPSGCACIDDAHGIFQVTWCQSVSTHTFPAHLKLRISNAFHVIPARRSSSRTVPRGAGCRLGRGPIEHVTAARAAGPARFDAKGKGTRGRAIRRQRGRMRRRSPMPKARVQPVGFGFALRVVLSVEVACLCFIGPLSDRARRVPIASSYSIALFTESKPSTRNESCDMHSLVHI